MESYAAMFIVPVSHYLMIAYITILPKSVTDLLRQHHIFTVVFPWSICNYFTQLAFQVTCIFAKSITIRVTPCDLFLSTRLHNHVQKIPVLLKTYFSTYSLRLTNLLCNSIPYVIIHRRQLLLLVLHYRSLLTVWSNSAIAKSLDKLTKNYQKLYSKKLRRIKILETHTAPKLNIFLTGCYHLNGRWYQRNTKKKKPLQTVWHWSRALGLTLTFLELSACLDLTEPISQPLELKENSLLF